MLCSKNLDNGEKTKNNEGMKIDVYKPVEKTFKSMVWRTCVDGAYTICVNDPHNFIFSVNCISFKYDCIVEYIRYDLHKII